MRSWATAVLIAPALAGCGTSAGVTTSGGGHGGSPPKRSVASLVGCQKTDRKQLVSAAPGARHVLVPGHPWAMLLCRYGGLNAHPRLGLISSRTVTDRATVARLAHELDALARGPSRAINCPADFGDAVIAEFVYPTLGDPVTLGLSGCAQVSNGHVQRLAGPAHSPVVGQLEGLTRR